VEFSQHRGQGVRRFRDQGAFPEDFEESGKHVMVN
jgi:hypothetical protein